MKLAEFLRVRTNCQRREQFYSRALLLKPKKLSVVFQGKLKELKGETLESERRYRLSYAMLSILHFRVDFQTFKQDISAIKIKMFSKTVKHYSELANLYVKLENGNMETLITCFEKLLGASTQYHKYLATNGVNFS